MEKFKLTLVTLFFVLLTSTIVHAQENACKPDVSVYVKLVIDRNGDATKITTTNTINNGNRSCRVEVKDIWVEDKATYNYQFLDTFNNTPNITTQFNPSNNETIITFPKFCVNVSEFYGRSIKYEIKNFATKTTYGGRLLNYFEFPLRMNVEDFNKTVVEVDIQHNFGESVVLDTSIPEPDTIYLEGSYKKLIWNIPLQPNARNNFYVSGFYSYEPDWKFYITNAIALISGALGVIGTLLVDKIRKKRQQNINKGVINHFPE